MKKIRHYLEKIKNDDLPKRRIEHANPNKHLARRM